MIDNIENNNGMEKLRIHLDLIFSYLYISSKSKDEKNTTNNFISRNGVENGNTNPATTSTWQIYLL